jgi:hypothetical protein
LGHAADHEQGLITAERNSSGNKRFLNVNLADKGRQVLGNAMPLPKEIVDPVMLSITDSDAALLEQKLRILTQNANHGLEGPTN